MPTRLDVEAFVRRPLAMPSGAVSLRAERKRISAEIAEADRAAVLVMKLSRGLQRWGDIDSFACFITGPAWRAGGLSDERVRKWKQSRDWVWRRVAAVSTVPLNSRARGGDGDAKRTLMICRLLIADPHDLVQKAVSWALRELAKREPASARPS
jgi:hypothetical protein